MKRFVALWLLVVIFSLLFVWIVWGQPYSRPGTPPGAYPYENPPYSYPYSTDPMWGYNARPGPGYMHFNRGAPGYPSPMMEGPNYNYHYSFQPYAEPRYNSYHWRGSRYPEYTGRPMFMWGYGNPRWRGGYPPPRQY